MLNELADLGEAGGSFICEFFRDNDDIPRFLTKAFVQPLDFEDLLGCIMPEEGLRKVVILDGHPRTGKTWASVAAVATLIDQNGWQSHQWWTGGADSLVVCEMNSNLLNSARRVQAELEARPDLKLVLLDDFLGANSLRDLGPLPQREDLARFLQWDEENPWLRALRAGCTLVIVERSMFFTLAEILLHVNIRGGQPSPSDIRVVSKSHGVFRHKENGFVIGSFDETLLGEIVKSNSVLHPLRDDGPKWWNKWLLSNVPMVTLSPWPELDSGERKSLWTQLDLEEKNAASWSFFGNDLASMAEEIQKLERLPDTDSALPDLAAAYLVLLAPALIFLGPTAYEALGLEEQWAAHLQQRLYMSLAIEDQGRLISSGRVPNELYMWALIEHVEQNLPLLVRVCWYVVERWTPQAHQEIVFGLLMRGILERALNSNDQDARRSQITREGTWDKFRQRAKPDPLLAIEGESGEYRVAEGNDLEPGVSAAVGWLLYRFFHGHSPLREQIHAWFRRGIDRSFERWSISDPAQREALWDKLVGSFSPLLQWAIRASKEKFNSEELTKVDEVRLSLRNTVARDRLRMVVEDELIWGHVYTATNAQHKSAEWKDPAVKQLISQVFHFLHDSTEELRSDTMSQAANRVFSLAWHNEWMPIADGRRVEFPGDEEFARHARRYFDRFKSIAFDAIRQNPGVLDDNLQYHWVHYVTQHAVWMRQWCFELDPDEYERRRGAPGSSYPEDNADLTTIFGLLLAGTPTKKRARNCLLLIGARAERLPDCSSLRDILDSLSQAGSRFEEEVREGLLQALFELMRQGYLNSHKVPSVLDIWSQEFALGIMANRLDTSWADYWSEVRSLSHPFDLLPPEKKGWQQIMPWHWHQL